MRVGSLVAAAAALVLSSAFSDVASARPPLPFPPEWSPPAPAEPVVHDPAASASTTAASVAQHYVDVGRKIGLFAQDRGAAAASKLWERFRYIRIYDALLDPTVRDETDARLRRIEDSLAADCWR